MNEIYLDYCATTPTDPGVVEAMLPYFHDLFGNASSRTHATGRRAAEAVDLAREQLSSCIKCRPSEVVWLSGATEANNLAVKGVAKHWCASGRKPGHIISQMTEHKAILDPLASLVSDGWDVTLLPVDSHGLISPAALAAAIRPDTALVTVMWVNNELGTVLPLAEIASLCESHEIPLHSDASQAVGKVTVDMDAIGVDLLSLSAHKFYGPKGVGALVVRRNTKRCKPHALQDGGGHERGFRSGTLNVPAIVGLGAAAVLIEQNLAEEGERIRLIRDAFERDLLLKLPSVSIHCTGAARVPHISNVAFHGVDSECLLMQTRTLAASTGSACSTSAFEPSHVLQALGIPEAEQTASVRFSFGRYSTASDAAAAVEILARTVPPLRSVGRRS